MYESKVKSRETDRLFEAILSLQSVEECYRLFDDLCTFNEVVAMSQRFHVAEMLAKGTTFTTISEKTGVSSATITRVNRCVHYGAGGYRLVHDRLKEQEKAAKKAAREAAKAAKEEAKAAEEA